MLRVKLKNFRCFAAPNEVEIRPITFLVGENSSGKTSFMAALRQLVETFKRSPQGNSFNRDPYFLGGYDQIAHYRGGKFGRAKTFSISMTLPASPELSEASASGRPRRGQTQFETQHSFTFAKGTPQPELSSYRYSSGSTAFDLNLTGDKPKIELTGFELFPQQFDTKRLPPVHLLRSDLSYLRYVFDDIYFRISRESDTTINRDMRAASPIYRDFRNSTFMLSRTVFASAPIRTEPERTYTPSELVSSPGGSHVPLEMAKQKIMHPEDWKGIQQSLINFGKNSGLFENIEIRLLGKQVGDPFQIMIKTGGPSINLVDVGYGVSQALPIIYQLQNSGQYNTYLLQQPEVHLHPRAQAELGTLLVGLARARKNTIYVIETHSDYILDRVRIEVGREKISPEKITIIYFERNGREVHLSNLYLSDKGDILNPPNNFRSFFLREQEKLLGI